jgi:hypothetical protein
MQVFSTLRHAAAFSALLLMFIDPARAAEQKPSHGSVDLSMGSEDVHLQGHCLRMSATIADSSLAKLHKKRTTTGIEFVRGKTPVDQYPDELMVEVTVTDCASPYSVPVDAHIFRDLHFTAAWRRGDDERSSELYAPHPRFDEAQASDTFRTFELSIPSANVPLSDRLLVNVFSADEKLAQFLTDF